MISAVALKYPENADCPFISYKAKGKLAEKLLDIANENKIPVVKNEALANILTVEEIGECIPEQTWEVVAKILAFVSEL